MQHHVHPCRTPSSPGCTCGSTRRSTATAAAARATAARDNAIIDTTTGHRSPSPTTPTRRPTRPTATTPSPSTRRSTGRSRRHERLRRHGQRRLTQLDADRALDDDDDTPQRQRRTDRAASTRRRRRRRRRSGARLRRHQARPSAPPGLARPTFDRRWSDYRAGWRPTTLAERAAASCPASRHADA